MSTDQASILNFVIRMVVPMRREFGRSLDVQQFMRDDGYAQAVLEQALTSRDQRLLDYAAYVSRHLGGARNMEPPTPRDGEPATRPMHLLAPEIPATAASAVTPATPTPAEAPAVDATEAELRARMLRKYTSGLR